jgi:hypothetical protein
VSVPFGSFGCRMTEQFIDHRQTVSGASPDTRERVPQIMKSKPVQISAARYQRPRPLKVRTRPFRIIASDHKFPNSQEIVEDSNGRRAKHNGFSRSSNPAGIAVPVVIQRAPI